MRMKSLKFVFGRVENIVGKDIFWLPAFFPFLTMFSGFFFFQGLCGKALTLYQMRKNKLGTTKLKAFADEKSNVSQMTISVHDRVENI